MINVTKQNIKPNHNFNQHTFQKDIHLVLNYRYKEISRWKASDLYIH